jgi:PAS domain S-box-containing protein
MLLASFALIEIGFLLHVLVWPRSIPFGGESLADLVFLVPVALILIALRHEFAIHFRRDDRREAVADILLVAAAAGAIAFLYLQLPGSTRGDLSAVLFTSTVVAPVAWGALGLWAPSLRHLGLFVSWSAISAGVVGFGYQWIRHRYTGGQPAIDLPLGLGALGIAAILVTATKNDRTALAVSPPRRIRPILTVTAVTAACAALAVAAGTETTKRATPLESAVTVGILASAIAFRILLNQVRTTRATADATRALAEKDDTLRETDETLHRLREVHESLATSEERLRLLFDVAVDGIVELDGEGVIRRANEAFCTMMELPQEEVLGRGWEELAESVDASASLQGLPVTGQAVLMRDGNEVHLAGRVSELPGPDSGRLLVIRDVSADKVAEMTIRSLFKFLQDRDEDRSRLLRRTNSAIEAERNRIARDLHDGPVQGISAASLSLEAVLLMLRTGDVEGGVEMLAKIREELSKETDNLRRLMSDLRPPVLEERGLIPAIRDTLARFGLDFDVTTQFHARALVDVPADLETLAYRVVQEALTNAAKHAQATEVTVSVEAEAGQLRVEVTDNGKGFEPDRAREFLRLGRVGLASMRERTELASGTFMVRSTPGSGTTVAATLPLDVVPTRTGAEAALR